MRFYFILFVFFVYVNSLFSAVYNLPTSLVNMPVYKYFEKNDLVSGLSSGIYTQNSLTGFEFDIFASYSPIPRMMVGLNLMTKSNIVLHLHYNLYDKLNSKFKIVGGVANISINGKSKLSSFDDMEVTQDTNISPYIVMSYLTSLLNFHVGFGGERFQFTDKNNAKFPDLNGLIFGFELPFSTSSFSLEYDGKDFNVGSKLQLSKSTSLFLSLTELGYSSDKNPQYNDQPVRWLSLGVTHLFNSKKPDEERAEVIKRYNLGADELDQMVDEIRKTFDDELNQWQKERKKYQDEIDRLRYAVQEDIRYIDQEDLKRKEELRQGYLTMSQDVSEKVLSYYYRSFEYFSNKEHYKAIALLQKAIILNPYLPQLYVRLGSIYFDLDLIDMAIVQWEKAIECDPSNIKLRQFVDVIKD